MSSRKERRAQRKAGVLVPPSSLRLVPPDLKPDPIGQTYRYLDGVVSGLQSARNASWKLWQQQSATYLAVRTYPHLLVVTWGGRKWHFENGRLIEPPGEASRLLGLEVEKLRYQHRKEALEVSAEALGIDGLPDFHELMGRAMGFSIRLKRKGVAKR